MSSTRPTVAVKLVLFSYVSSDCRRLLQEVLKCELEACIYTWCKPYKLFSLRKIELRDSKDSAECEVADYFKLRCFRILLFYLISLSIRC